MDGVVSIVALAVCVGAWWWIAKRLKSGGKNWFLRHLAGSCVGTFSALLIVAVALEIDLIQPAEQPSADPAMAYTITEDEYREGRPRKVEVLLPRRLSEAELAEVAAVVRDDTDKKPTKTFIGFRVEGQNNPYYWANARFDPEYQSTLIGLSADDYQKLLAMDLSSYPDRVAHWLRDGALGHVMVLYKRDGQYRIDSIFTDGANTETYVGSELPDGDLRLEEPENDFEEYYILRKDKTLEGWGKDGMYMTLPAVEG